jgi:hypothetical protein
MFIKDLPKGVVVRLANGWLAKTLSDLRTYTPVCEVYGDYTEAGSVYAHDMMQVFMSNETNKPLELKKGESGDDVASRHAGYWADLEHTEKQNQMRRDVAKMESLW